MDRFFTFCLMCFGASTVICAPTKEKSLSLYDAIVEACPSVAHVAKYNDEPIFKSCHNWDKNISVKAFTDDADSKKDVLCLLYFYSFTQYCSHSDQINTTVSNDKTSKYNLDMICDNVKIIPKQIPLEDSLRKAISTKDDCKRLCGDGYGYVVVPCLQSYYFGHIKTNTTPHAEKVKHLISVNEDQALLGTQNKGEIEPIESKPKPSLSQPQLTADTNPVENTIDDPVNEVKLGSKVEKNQDGVEEQAVGKDVNDKNDNGPIKDEPTHDKNVDTSAVETSVNKNGVITSKTDNVSVNTDQNKNKPELAVDVDQTKDKPNLPESNAAVPPKVADVNQDIQDSLTNKNPLQDKTSDNDLNGNEDMETNGDILQQPIDQGESEEEPEEPAKVVQSEKAAKPVQIDETEAVNFSTEMDGDSYFFTYFMLLCVIFIVGYVCYHNKQKILALILEGRRGKRQFRGRRPNSANYHKLDSNLEEAITSSCSKNTNNVIY